MEHDGECINLIDNHDTPIITYPEDPYCSCNTNYCECDQNSSITKKVAMDIYKHLGFPGGRSELRRSGYRLCALHVWGTDNLNSDSLLKWLQEYQPKNIEWINDSSCNIIFDTEESILRIISDMTEPFDRDVAAAAALTVVANLARSRSTNGDTEDVIDLESDYTPEFMPVKGNWFKAPCVPEGAIALYLKFAHKSDVKLPGAEKRSRYYEKYGNPNAQSRNELRAQAKANRKSKPRNGNEKGRSLVSYVDLYEDEIDPYDELQSSGNKSVFQRNPNLNYYVELANDDVDKDMITVTHIDTPKRSQAGNRHSFRNKQERVVPDGPLNKYPRSGPNFGSENTRTVTLSDRWRAMHQAGIVGNISPFDEIERQARGYSFNQPGLSMRRNGRYVPTDLSTDIAEMKINSPAQANKNHQPFFKAGAFNQRKLLTSMGMIADIVEKEKTGAKSGNYFDADRTKVHQRLQTTGQRYRNKSIHNRLY